MDEQLKRIFCLKHVRIASYLPVLLLVFFAPILIVSAWVYAGQATDSGVVDISAVVPGAFVLVGSGGQNPLATVVLSGFTFPSAKLTLLKDGAVLTNLLANSDGTFQINVNDLTFGNYQFSIYATDGTGAISNPHTINASVFSSQPYIHSNIIIPPTINAKSVIVPSNGLIEISGFVAGGSVVTLELPGAGVLMTGVANDQGQYQLNLPATLVPAIYQFRTKSTLHGVSSLYSRPVQVLIYKSGTPIEEVKPPVQLGLCVDFSRDGRVNLIDFSILLFWLDKPNPPSTIDCNNDKIIDMKDFSILIYFWTG